jgi:hypothetical protein
MNQETKEAPSKLAHPLLTETQLVTLDLMSVQSARYPILDSRNSFESTLTPSESVRANFFPDERRAVALVSISVKAEADNDLLSEFSAIYRVVYVIKDSYHGDRLEERAIAFCDSYALAHVWPYWRELLASLSMRMGLPTILAPMLIVGAKGPNPVQTPPTASE